MKKTALVFIFAFMLSFIMVATLGGTSARYQTNVTVTGEIDFDRTVGAISLFRPDKNNHYDATSNSFNVDEFNSQLDMWFAVNNNRTVDGIPYVNQVQTQYYIRIVPSQGEDLPIEYNNVYVHLVDPSDGDKGERWEQRDQAGWGSFTLPTGSNDTKYYSMTIHWTGLGIRGLQNFKVQMVQKADGVVKKISETDLNLKVSDTIKLTANYYQKNTDPGKLIGTKFIEINRGESIHVNFKDANQLKQLKIEVPAGYAFSYAVSYQLMNDWNGFNECDLSEIDAGKFIEVWCDNIATVNVKFVYRNRTTPIKETDAQGNEFDSFERIAINGKTEQTLEINKGTVIDFANMSNLPAEVRIPEGYKFIAAHCDIEGWANDDVDSAHWFHSAYKIPEQTNVEIAQMSIYVAPVAETTLNVSTVLEVAGNTSVKPTVSLAFGSDGKATPYARSSTIVIAKLLR